MFKQLSDNLNLLMAKSRLNSSELARQTGLPATTIKRIRNNEHTNPTLSTLVPIANYFSVTLNDLLKHEGSPAPVLKLASGGVRTLPLLSWQSCLQFSEIELMPKLTITTERRVSEKAFALEMDNNDIALFPQHARLIVEPEIPPESGDYVLVANLKQKMASLRRFIIEIDNTYLQPLIAGLNAIVLTSEYKILGVIIQTKMELKPEK